MHVPVGDDLSTNRGIVDVTIEETMSLDFDLSNSNEYVDTGAVNGRILVDFELNRSALLDRIERADSPSVRDQIHMRLEGWSVENADPNEFWLDFGRLLFKGAEPLDLDETISLGGTFWTKDLADLSPDELKQKLRTEERYETTYSEIADDIAAYLEREGVVADPSFRSPLYMQAKSRPAVQGTDYTITIENNEPVAIGKSTVEVSMGPETGPEVTVGHAGDRDGPWEGEHLVSGSYDPEKEVFAFDIEPTRKDSAIPPSDSGDSIREIRFNVPASAQRDLHEIAGEAWFSRGQPFSNLSPVALFDAGGHRLDRNVGTIRANGYLEATFQTPTTDVAVSSQQEITKTFRVEGVLPRKALNEMEAVLQERGIQGYRTQDVESNRDMREGKEVTIYSGGLKEGSVLVDDARIGVDIDVRGEVRTSDLETRRDSDENLPAERRSIAKEYGETNVTIRGRGTDNGAVDAYVSELRDEMQMRVKSISEAM